MEEEFKKITYLLACIVAYNSQTPTAEILKHAEAYAKGLPLDNTLSLQKATLDADVEEIYKLYPAKCPVRGTSTSKCSKDKTRIKQMLKSRSKESIKMAIQNYLNDCSANNSFLKNFSTLLNNLPDADPEGDLFAVPAPQQEEQQPAPSPYR